MNVGDFNIILVVLFKLGGAVRTEYTDKMPQVGLVQTVVLLREDVRI